MNDNIPVNPDDVGEAEKTADLAKQGSDAPLYKPEVYAPRSVWFEFFLGLFTFTISWSFWTVMRARDLKRMRSNNFVPWLWFFVPLVVLASLIAYPRMFSELRTIEGSRVNTAWHKTGWLWIASFVFFSLIAYFASDLEGYLWVWFIALVVVHLLLSLLHFRFNRLKHHDAQYLEFTGRRSWYAWWEWLLMIFGIGLVSLLVFGLWDEEQVTIETLPSTYQYQDEEHGFQLTINGEQWRRVVVGTHSDGTAEVEFSNYSDSAYLLVFEHEDSTLNSIASFRYGDMFSDFTLEPSCQEKRELNESQTSVESETVCLSEVAQDHEMSVSKLIKVGDFHYELLGYVFDDKKQYKAISKTLLLASQSFSEIEQGEAQ